MSTFHAIDRGTGILPLLSVEADVTTQPTTGTRTWTDVTPLVRRLQFTRSGRNDEFQRTSTGTLAALFSDRAGAFTALGPKKAQWLRVQAQWQGVTYPLWQGIIEGLTRQWPGAGHDATMQVAASDTLKILRGYPLQGQTFPSQRIDQRVSAILALPGVAAGSIDTDTDTADAVTTPLGQGTYALDQLLQLEISENGLLIADPAGPVSFQGRHWRLIHSSVAKGTFGEAAGQIPYKDTASYTDDDSRLANIVTVTPYGGGAAITVESTSSQATYWPRANQIVDRSLVISDTTIATDCANFLLGRYKDPSPRIPMLEADLAAVAVAAARNVGVLLGAANSDRFTWDRASSAPLSLDGYVEQISHTISFGGPWSVAFQLSPAADQSGWNLGDAANSVLGETTRLIY